MICCYDHPSLTGVPRDDESVVESAEVRSLFLINFINVSTQCDNEANGFVLKSDTRDNTLHPLLNLRFRLTAWRYDRCIP